MADKHYVGEFGTEMVVTTGKDLTGAAVLKMSVRRPDGSVVEWLSEQHAQNKKAMRYITKASDFNIAGEYKLQSVIGMGGWVGRGKTVKFIIYDKFE